MHQQIPIKPANELEAQIQIANAINQLSTNMKTIADMLLKIDARLNYIGGKIR